MKTSTVTGTAERVIRTTVQVVVASAAALPLLVTQLHIPTHTAAEITAYGGGAVVVLAWIQNYLEGKGWMPAMLKGIPTITPTTNEVQNSSSVIKPLLDNLTKAADVANTASQIANEVQWTGSTTNSDANNTSTTKS